MASTLLGDVGRFSTDERAELQEQFTTEEIYPGYRIPMGLGIRRPGRGNKGDCKPEAGKATVRWASGISKTRHGQG
ncbi:Protein of unknown function [Gryllus bimaculatus]|nr:Protein of unknown function [Gryllus bimaculatus]